MKTIELKGFVHCKPAEDWDFGPLTMGGLRYDFSQWENNKSIGYALVSPYTITLDIPDSYNPNGQFIEALEAEKKKAMADFQNRVTEIDRQISKYQAIEFSGESNA